MRRYLAIDLGGTKLSVGIVDEAGSLVTKTTGPARIAAGPEAVTEQIFTAAQSVLSEGGPVVEAGMTLPGLTDRATGTLVYAPYSGWRDVPFARMLSSRLGMNVTVENDVNASALAESRFGAGRSARCMLWVTVSTGIGGGIVVDGKVMDGAHGLSGEIGHIIVVEDGARCGCGNYGCAEAEAAGPAWRRKALELIERGRKSMLTALADGDTDRIDARMIAEAARHGDSLSLEVVEDVSLNLARALAAAVNVLDPDLVVIGGGVGMSFDLMQPVLAREIPRRSIASKLHECRVVGSELGYDAALVGAAASAIAPA